MTATGGNTLDRLYHYTDLNGLLNILQSDSMELCEQASICDIRKVCFTTNDSLWIHGEYRIEFNNKLLCHAKLNKWDYSNSFQQYAYEEEWYSAERITSIRECIQEIKNVSECVHIYQTEDSTTLYKVAALITWYGLGGEFSNMWYSIYAFLRDNKEYKAMYIDNDEMSSL